MSFVCSKCSSEDVCQLEWINPNTGKTFGYADDLENTQFCRNCEEYVTLEFVEDK